MRFNLLVLFGNKIDSREDENICRYLYYNQISEKDKEIPNHITKDIIGKNNYDLIRNIFSYYNICKVELKNGDYLFYHYPNYELYLINKHEIHEINANYRYSQFVFSKNIGTISMIEKENFEKRYYCFNLTYDIHNIIFIPAQHGDY